MDEITITGKQATAAKYILSKLEVKKEKNEYACQTNLKRILKITEELGTDKKDEEQRLAIEDKDGSLAKHPDGTYKFDRKNTQAMEKFWRKQMEQEFKFKPYVFPINDETKALAGTMNINDLNFLFPEELFAEPADEPEKPNDK